MEVNWMNFKKSKTDGTRFLPKVLFSFKIFEELHYFLENFLKIKTKLSTILLNTILLMHIRAIWKKYKHDIILLVKYIK